MMEQLRAEEYKEFLEKFDMEKTEALLTEHKQDCSFVFKPNQIGSPEKRLFSYKWMLSAVSPVFQAMFNGNHDESTVSSMDIKIDDISFEAFNLFLDYVYYRLWNASRWPNTHWQELLYIAEKYAIPQMVDDLQELVYNSVDNITAFNWRKLCKNPKNLKFREDILYDPRLGELDLEKFIELLESIGFKYGKGETRKYNLIVAYIKQKRYDVEAHNQSDAVMACNDDDGMVKSPRKIIQHLMNFVDFYEMPAEDYLKGPDLSNLLSIETKCAVLEHKAKSAVESSEYYEEFIGDY